MYTPSEITELRTELGLSKVEFSKKLKVSKSTVTLWEDGKRTPSGAGEKALNRLSGSQETRFLRTLREELDEASDLEFMLEDDTDQQIIKIFFSATSSYNQIKRALIASGGEIV